MAGQIYLVTGVMASGKSTVSELLAKRFEKGVHLRGDIFRRMIVSGREEMRENASEEAFAQLNMRYHLTAQAAAGYADAGFTVVVQDNYYGEALPDMAAMLAPYKPCIAVLAPDVQAVEAREKGRKKTGYTGFSVKPLYDMFMKETPRLGFWIDSTNLSPEETCEAIYRHYNK